MLLAVPATRCGERWTSARKTAVDGGRARPRASAQAGANAPVTRRITGAVDSRVSRSTHCARRRSAMASNAPQAIRQSLLTPSGQAKTLAAAVSTALLAPRDPMSTVAASAAQATAAPSLKAPAHHTTQDRAPPRRAPTTLRARTCRLDANARQATRGPSLPSPRALTTQGAVRRPVRSTLALKAISPRTRTRWETPKPAAAQRCPALQAPAVSTWQRAALARLDTLGASVPKRRAPSTVGPARQWHARTTRRA
mmetsp:Transcript_73361/g.174851  ORF Transcript_73361/g.174851 Transcript_73361/m.174851 type:complete len:254 (+) Transcript_73361:1554-2315(+)